MAQPRLLAVPPGEFVTLQGVADLAVLLPSEIWLLDFKTDAVAGKALDDAVEAYRPQVELYALALESVYRTPVRRKGLYFVHAREERWL